MSTLKVDGLRAGVSGREIITGVDLELRSGEVHVLMGPNGSGKSTLANVLMGRPGYNVLGGSACLDGVDLLGLPTWQRVKAGLFLTMQEPIEVPGVTTLDALSAALGDGGQLVGGKMDVSGSLAREATRLGLAERLLARPLNVDLSGGESKRNEVVQLAVLRPRFAVLDEIDSGLDVDALSAVAHRVMEATAEWGLGVLAITHYQRLLSVLHPDRVHVLVRGRIVASGGADLAEEVERTGYAELAGL
ncbi:MAG: Fe-S cluster assembly ATPase SufC [Actinobacteria bacterium]|nr:Fe-S cluster assembly ATPase SufC [Actinomycetota bacterium]